MKVIFDLDDCAPDPKRMPWPFLDGMKDRCPDFKVTLFTIPGLWQPAKLEEARDRGKDWIEFAVHGWYHRSNEEVLSWDQRRWVDVLAWCTDDIFVPGFKAPNWMMTPLGYRILRDHDWWVAVRDFQIPELPAGMRYYSWEVDPAGFHEHTWLTSARQAQGLFDWPPDTHFEFVSQNILS